MFIRIIRNSESSKVDCRDIAALRHDTRARGLRFRIRAFAGSMSRNSFGNSKRENDLLLRNRKKVLNVSYIYIFSLFTFLSLFRFSNIQTRESMSTELHAKSRQPIDTDRELFRQIIDRLSNNE